MTATGGESSDADGKDRGTSHGGFTREETDIGANDVAFRREACSSQHAGEEWPLAAIARLSSMRHY